MMVPTSSPRTTRPTFPGVSSKTWIGSALEYYDFFVYATAASLVFPDVFFPKGNPKVAIVESLATYGVGYAARPIGAFFLGRWGDKHGRKNVLVLCMLVQGVGMGLFQVAYFDTVTATIPARNRGVAGALGMATRTIGTVSGATDTSAPLSAAPAVCR